VTDPASVPSIAAAIEAALQPLLVANGGTTFKVVDHWSGDLSAAAAVENLTAQALNKAPGALIAFEGELADDDVTTVSGTSETAAGSTWSVIVFATTAGQTAKRAALGAAPVLGAYELVDPALGALNSLVIDGLLRVERLHYAGTRWFAAKRGQLAALALRFKALREAPQATPPDPSADFTSVRTTEALEPVDGETVPPTLDPFATFDS
jgi:hypothetical protein